MPYFTFQEKEEYLPVAKIKGGKHNNKIIYLAENEDDDTEEIDLKIPKNSRLNVLKDDIKRSMSGKRKEIEITDGKLIPIPRNDKRSTYFISGPEGSGKSSLASLIIHEYRKMNKKNPFYIFSKVDEDLPLDKLKPIRLELNSELIQDPIETYELENSVVLFDDIDTISSAPLLQELRRLRDNILEVGRHNNITILSLVHNMTNNKATKMSLLESAYVGFFPKMGDSYHINRYLKEYGGLSKQQIEKIYSLPSRWVLHHKRAPNWIMYEKGIYLL